MKVLMLGWEFPPYISGGLGTACYGLTKALSEQGAEIAFVLPRPVESSYSSHVRLLSSASVCHCDEGDLTGTVRLHALDVATYPYQYKFIVDGVWLNDPQAQEQIMNSYGTMNSIVRVE